MRMQALALMLLIAAVPTVAAEEEEVPCDANGCATDDDRGCDGLIAVDCTYDYHGNCQYKGPTDRVYCTRYTQDCWVSVNGICQTKNGPPHEAIDLVMVEHESPP